MWNRTIIVRGAAAVTAALLIGVSAPAGRRRHGGGPTWR